MSPEQSNSSITSRGVVSDPDISAREPRRRSGLITWVFFLSVLSSLATLASYLWPINPDKLIQVYGPQNKVGIIDASGRTGVEPVWDSIREFDRGGVALASLDETYHWIDYKGRVVIPPSVDLVVHPARVSMTFSSSGMARFKKGNLVGLINRKGKVIIEPEWEMIGTEFGHHELVRVTKDGKAGWINREGTAVIPPVWEAARPFDPNGIAAVRQGGKWAFINVGGEPLTPFQWEDIRLVGDPDREFFDAIGNPDLVIGVARFRGNYLELIPWNDESATYFDEGGLAGVKVDGKWGCINRQYDWVIDPNSAEPYKFNAIGLSKFSRDGRFGWIDHKGNIAAEAQWDAVGKFDRHGYCPVRRGDEHGWINRRGDSILHSAWNEVGDFDSRGMGTLKVGKKWGWVTTEGKVISPRWDTEATFNKWDIAIVSDRTLKWPPMCGLVNRNGESIVEPKWEHIGPFDPAGMAPVYKDGRWGWIDTSGNLVIPLGYDHTGDRWKPDAKMPKFDDRDMALVRIDHRWGWIDRSGNPILPLEFFHAEEFDENGLATVVRKLPPSLPDDDPEIYENLQWNRTGYAVVERIDRRGNTIMSLPGEGWLWKPARAVRGNGNHGYVAICDNAPLAEVRKWQLKFVRWLTNNTETVPETEFACMVFSPDGDIIWDSRTLRLETKRLIAFGVSSIVLFVASLKLVRRPTD